MTLSERAATDVDIPEFPTPPPTSAAAPVTGTDLAAPVLEPERAGGVVSRSSPTPTEPVPAPAEPATIPDLDDEIWNALSERMRESVREACAEERLVGPVCEQV